MFAVAHRNALAQVHSVVIFKRDEIADRAELHLAEGHGIRLGFDRLHFRTAMGTGCEHKIHLSVRCVPGAKRCAASVNR
jgi:hypothetical protein